MYLLKPLVWLPEKRSTNKSMADLTANPRGLHTLLID